MVIAGCYVSCDNQAKEMGADNRRELACLDELAERRFVFRDSMRHLMDSTMLRLHKDLSFGDKERYDINKRMLSMAQMYSFDYADQFARKIMLLSDNIGDPDLIAESRVLSSFYLTQSCLFVESLEMLHSVNVNNNKISNHTRSLYYFYYAIAYQRMAVYVKDSLNSKKYNLLGEDMFKRCIDCTDDLGMKFFAEGRIYERRDKMHAAQLCYEKALRYIEANNYNLRSLAMSSLAKSFKHQGLHEKAAPYYMKATELDILQAQNSSIAIVDLADHLYYHYGNIEEASKYLEIAIDNGEFYGMRSQITRVDRMIPALSSMKERRKVTLFVSIMSVLVILLIVVIMLMWRYSRARMDIVRFEDNDYKHTKKNSELSEENSLLRAENVQLSDANDLKNEYIGKLLESNSELTKRVEDFAVKTKQKLNKGQDDQVRKLLVELEGRLNRKEQQANFDKIFLAMFPNFIEQFNGLLKPENRMEPSEKELMSPSMRIFALIRLGLKDNQQIAKVLDYSYNTILNYRVRTRGGAKNPETFESDIMNIQ